jgi:hypothetical protein
MGLPPSRAISNRTSIPARIVTRVNCRMPMPRTTALNSRTTTVSIPSPPPGERARVRGRRLLSFVGRVRASWGGLQRLLCCVMLLLGHGAQAGTWFEDFSANPQTANWRSFGDATLFRWNNTNHYLEVTWDSSHTNSFFYHRLGTILTKGDDFSFAFDLQLKDIHYGTSVGKTDTFEIAIGLFNSQNITNANYFRGSGQNATYGVRNLVEFNYFPDAGFGATVSSTVVSTNNRIKPAHNFPLEMTGGDSFRIALSYTASNQVLRTQMQKNGVPFGMPPDNSLADLVLTSHPDLRVDSFGVSSYSDAIQTGPPNFWGSILAHGILDNVNLTTPPPPVQALTLSFPQSTTTLSFFGQTNWLYTLQRSIDLTTWTSSAPPLPGHAGIVSIADTNQPAGNVFYRIAAERP